ncbi:MAG: DUF6544 family protein [Dysgonamonadaceae bacterium]|mgnify:CR=1 FL=1|jgi:hypothetical protein|nr:hypothetical protein [Dysgonamonadaceae bacterium]MDD3900658.1 hypothetical protein [Dysgonamonadaceae bacterium]MEA5080179.1 DUF6544 family protein [Dysgonamonadaceae bacterium]
MKSAFKKEKEKELQLFSIDKVELITEKLIQHFPEAIKNYLKVCGYMNRLMPMNANVIWNENFLRDKPNSSWEALEALHFLSVDPIVRCMYVKSKNKPVSVKDSYKDQQGSLQKRLFDVFPLLNAGGKYITQSEQTTVFSEFMIIPGYIFQPYVWWDPIDSNKVKGTFTDERLRVKGIFHFNDEGLFTRFESNDRFYNRNGKYVKIPFSAFIESYKNQDGILIPEKIRAVWHFTKGDFEFFKGTIDRIDFNVSNNNQES